MYVVMCVFGYVCILLCVYVYVCMWLCVFVAVYAGTSVDWLLLCDSGEMDQKQANYERISPLILGELIKSPA